MSMCNLTGCKKPDSLLFSYSAGPAYHRYCFCSFGHLLTSLYRAGLIPLEQRRTSGGPGEMPRGDRAGEHNLRKEVMTS